MNLLSQVQIKVLYSSTQGAVGSTGDAGGTTAGSTAQAGQSTQGGFPTASTGVDMASYGGALLLAIVQNTTSAILKSGYSVVGTSAAVTGWTDLAAALAGFNTTTLSTASAIVALDVTKPGPRYINAIVQVPTSSANVNSILAVLYEPDKQPVSQSALIAAITAIGSTV